MELNIKLPSELQKKLREVTELEPKYCVRSDIDRDGLFKPDIFAGATERELFCICDGQIETIPLEKCEDITVSPQVDNGLLVLKTEGEERIFARFTQKHSVQFACLARGAVGLKNGRKTLVENNDREKECPICGRVPRGTGQCPKCNKKSRSLARVLDICGKYKGILLITVLIMTAVTALSLGQQFVLRYFVDEHLMSGNGTLGDICAFMGIYVGIILLTLVLNLVKSFLCSRLGMKIGYDLRAKLSAHIQRLSMSYINKRNPGELLERVFTDTFRVRRFFSDCFCDMFAHIIKLVALAVVMLCLNVKLALAAFVFVPPILVFSRTFWPHIRKIYHRQHKKGDKINSKLQDVLSGIRVVKSYGREGSETEIFRDLNEDFASVQRKNELFFATVFPILSLLLSLGTYIIVYLGGLDVLNGTMTVGELSQFVSYAGMLLGPLNWMSFLPRQIVNMTTGLDRIYDVLDSEPEVKASEKSVKHEIKGDISFKNVVFGYRSHEPVLDGIDIDVKPGEMIGLVGASGSGKSTFINLVMRLYDTQEGSITVDGYDIKELDPSDYHRQIGVVLQETFLFAGTVLENIRFARPEASLEEVIRAAKAANAHEFICRLSDGYNTYIGEKGHMLSGGEKQRIAIARAILGDPRILILDEATSALDTESEYQIQQALERLRQGRTTFAIAHRLSTLRCADRIAVIDGKKIAELGTHNELLKAKGIYYGLVTAQLEMNKT